MSLLSLYCTHEHTHLSVKLEMPYRVTNMAKTFTPTISNVGEWEEKSLLNTGHGSFVSAKI